MTANPWSNFPLLLGQACAGQGCLSCISLYPVAFAGVDCLIQMLPCHAQHSGLSAGGQGFQRISSLRSVIQQQNRLTDLCLRPRATLLNSLWGVQVCLVQVVVLADGGSLLVRETWLQQTNMQVSESSNDSLCHTVAKESGLKFGQHFGDLNRSIHGCSLQTQGTIATCS